MILGTFRVLVGFVLACLAAGAVNVAFAVTPAELAAASSERLWQAGEWALLSATESFVFAAPFALIAIVLAEWLGIRTFAYHGLVGILIAAAAFAVLVHGQSPDTASLANSYAIAAYLSTGLVAGIVYWLFSGRLSGGRRITRRLQQREMAEQQADRPAPKPASRATATATTAAPTTAAGSGASVPPIGNTVPSASKATPPVGKSAAKPAG